MAFRLLERYNLTISLYYLLNKFDFNKDRKTGNGMERNKFMLLGNIDQLKSKPVSVPDEPAVRACFGSRLHADEAYCLYNGPLASFMCQNH